MDTPVTPTTETITVQGQAPVQAAKSHLWAGDHFSFHDLLDAINPLQHIPIISTIYREVTGDTIGNAARVAGDGLYGGVIGVIAGLFDVSVLEATGKDVGQTVIAAVTGDDDKPAVAAASDAPAPATSTTATTAATPASPPPSTAAASAPKPAADPPPAAQAAATGIPLVPAAAPAPLMALSTAPKLMPLNGQARSFPIDTSPEGILALRTTANSAPRPVPLNIPGGAMPQFPRVPTTGTEFAQRMQEGLDKYKALLASRAAGTGGAVDQLQ
ncbi:hypothetical protein [Aliidongia dinghuensis]|nr:hypothetical protein [Aliidongia dinghuensis]